MFAIKFADNKINPVIELIPIQIDIVRPTTWIVFCFLQSAKKRQKRKFRRLSENGNESKLGRMSQK